MSHYHPLSLAPALFSPHMHLYQDVHEPASRLPRTGSVQEMRSALKKKKKKKVAPDPTTPDQ